MNIEPIQPIITKKHSQLRAFKKKCQLVGTAFSALGYVAKDIFIRREKNYIKVDGKFVEESDLPRCILGMKDCLGVKWVDQIVFSPEDTEKLRSMKKKDYTAYRNKLLESGKYNLLPLDE